MVAAAIIPLSLAYIGDNFPYEERQAAIGEAIVSDLYPMQFNPVSDRRNFTNQKDYGVLSPEPTVIPLLTANGKALKFAFHTSFAFTRNAAVGFPRNEELAIQEVEYLIP